MKIWLNHFAINFGSLLRLLWLLLQTTVFMWIPPQLHHSKEECEGLREFTVWECFLSGFE